MTDEEIAELKNKAREAGTKLYPGGPAWNTLGKPQLPHLSKCIDAASEVWLAVVKELEAEIENMGYDYAEHICEG